jgi:hypothetical protein
MIRILCLKLLAIAIVFILHRLGAPRKRSTNELVFTVLIFKVFLVPTFCTIRIIVATLSSTFNSLIVLSVAFFTPGLPKGTPT